MTRNMTQQINKPSNINDFTHIITGSIPVRVTTNESHNQAKRAWLWDFYVYHFSPKRNRNRENDGIL